MICLKLDCFIERYQGWKSRREGIKFEILYFLGFFWKGIKLIFWVSNNE